MLNATQLIILFQFTVIENRVHACSLEKYNSKEAFVCRKFDNEKKEWDYVDHIEVPTREISRVVLLPNGGIFILLKTRNMYLYDGMKSRSVSQNGPFYRGSDFADYNCHTPISNEEFVVGMASKRKENNAPDKYLYFINIKTGVRNVTVAKLKRVFGQLSSVAQS